MRLLVTFLVLGLIATAAPRVSAQLFLSPVTYPTGSGSRATCVGDFNGDGKADLAIANEFSGNVSVLLGIGDGTFGASVNYGAGTSPTSIATADFNGDSNLDLVIANAGSANISILLGIGDGTFAGAVNYGVGNNPHSVIAADFNGDIKVDLAVANRNDGTVSILLGIGNGTFGPAVAYTAAGGASAVATAKLNGDNALDLVVANFNASNVTVLLGVGNGSFGPPTAHASGSNPFCICVKDFNGDNKIDVATGNWGSGDASIFLGNGDGTLATPVSYITQSSPVQISSTDFNGDNIPDVAVANWSSFSITILIGNGNGTFVSADNYSVGNNPTSVAAGNFDGGSKLDLAVTSGASGNVGILINQSIGGGADTAAFTVTSQDSGDVYEARVGDLDRDLSSDVVYCGLQNSGLFVAYGQIGGGFEAPVSILAISVAGVQLDFVNADTLLDIVAATVDSVYVVLNNGNRSYSVLRFPASSNNLANKSPEAVTVPSVTTGYFNGDDYLDIIVSPQSLYSGNGTGAISSQPVFPFTFDAVARTDVNGDNIDDIAVIRGDSLVYYSNDGLATLTVTAEFLVGTPSNTSPTRLMTGDFDADGKWDAAVLIDYASSANSGLNVLYGNGTAGVGTTEHLIVTGSAYAMDKADPNSDGRIDFVVTNATTGQLDIFSGSSSGFSQPYSVDVPAGANTPLVTAALDQDRDGNTDLVTGTAGGGNIFVSSNDGAALPVLPEEMFVTAYSNATLRVENPQKLIISQNLRTVAGSDYWRMDFDGDDSLDEQSMDYNLVKGEYRIVAKRKPNKPGAVRIAIGIDGSQNRLLANALSFGTGANKYDATANDSIVLYFPMEDTSTIFPGVGLPTNSLKPIFNWTLRKNPSATQFQFQLDEHPLFPTLRIDQLIPTATANFTPATSLGKDSVYYWRFRELVGGVWSEYSHPFAVYVTGCCLNLRGNVNGSVGDAVNVVDITYLVAYLFQGGAAPPCKDEADVNGNGTVNVVDLTFLVQRLFQGGPPPAVCP